MFQKTEHWCFSLCLHIVEFVCLKIFINFWVKTYHCFNLSHMSHYFIALLEFFFIWVILSFPFRWTGSIWKSPVFGWSQTQLPSVYYLHMLRLDLAFSWLFPCSREILRDFFFFPFQSLWIFFSFHSYVFVCVCSWCLLDSNIIYLQVAAQHNTNFHVLAGSLHFSSIIYRDLPFFFPSYMVSEDFVLTFALLCLEPDDFFSILTAIEAHVSCPRDCQLPQ